MCGLILRSPFGSYCTFESPGVPRSIRAMKAEHSTALSQLLPREALSTLISLWHLQEGIGLVIPAGGGKHGQLLARVEERGQAGWWWPQAVVWWCRTSAGNASLLTLILSWGVQLVSSLTSSDLNTGLLQSGVDIGPQVWGPLQGSWGSNPALLLLGHFPLDKPQAQIRAFRAVDRNTRSSYSPVLLNWTEVEELRTVLSTWSQSMLAYFTVHLSQIFPLQLKSGNP